MQAAQISDPQPLPFEFALRIRHPSMDPALISKELRLEAHHSFKAGQVRQAHTNLAPPSYHAESYWLATLDLLTLFASAPSFQVPVAGKPMAELARDRLETIVMRDLDSALSWCTRNVLRSHADFLKRITSDGGQIYLLVTLSMASAAGFTLTPELSRTLSDLGVSLNFEFTLRE